jgi:hypothetical protein
MSRADREGGIEIAELEQYFGASGNDGGRAGVKRDTSGRPGGPLPAMMRENAIDPCKQPNSCQPSIAPLRHGSAACMILLPRDHDPVLPDGNYSGDDACYMPGRL